MGVLDDKVAIVTGGASGIGRAVALTYAREGARVVVADLDETRGRETVEHIRARSGEAVFVRTDVAAPEACRALVAQAVSAFGRLDLACNNAGISGEWTPTADCSLEGWDRVIRVNLSSVFYCLKYQIPAMLEAGGGAIVNMASIFGQVGFAAAPAYVAAKHGVVGLTRSAALDYAGAGIRVNAVGPAFIRTPMLAGLGEAAMRGLVELHPIGRAGEPEEVAELVLWLSSSKASYVTGAYYPVDGGYLAQ